MAILGTALVFSAGEASVAYAQQQGAEPAASEAASEKHNASSTADVPSETNAVTTTSQGTLPRLVERFVGDQREIWTSPAKLRLSDTVWLVPLSGITAGLFVTDRDFSQHLSQNPTTISHYKTVSNVGVAALAGGAGGMWLLGHVKHNEHWSETGFLAGEAALNSLVAVEELKYSLRRLRPLQGDGSGPFFQGGGTSFPSEHAAAAWSVAGVIGHEYPGLFTKMAVYGLASLVSVSRVRAEQHFPSDVVVGSIIGNLVAQNIYSRHHDPDLGGGEWRSISQLFRGEGSSSAGGRGSPYVSLDSWIYPIFGRLIALGYIPSGMLGQRPWTRLECARLLEEASDVIETRNAASAEASRLLDALREEFAAEEGISEGSENRGLRLESIYTSITEISGKPLTDPYHFGQTLLNNYGRPYEQGLNSVAGFSGWATEGRWVVYARGEYQHAPSGPAYSDTVRNFIAQVDGNPIQPASPISTTNHFQLLDAYVGLTLSNWQLSYGQQSLWWGPGKMGPLLFSDNAAPLRMLQLNRTVPIRLPWLFRYLGPVHMDAFFGSLQGHQFPPHPVMHGEKISFKPTPNLEFGFSRTVILGGIGRPLTPTALWNSYVSVTSSTIENPGTDPGKRDGGFDFSYRVPFLRNWLTVYADSIATDDPSPLASPRRAGINPGIYMPQFPGLRKLDLRVEAAYTDVPSGESNGGHFIYYDGFYHDLYTNKGQLLGNWVGRDGKGVQAWSRYWIDAHTSLELGYRHGEVSGTFVPGGGNINDGSIRAEFWLHRVWNVTASLQFERWRFPLLATGPQTNVTSSLGITFFPPSWRYSDEMRKGSPRTD
jgi:membrane-associated phospholipid phosphatase